MFSRFLTLLLLLPAGLAAQPAESPVVLQLRPEAAPSITIRADEIAAVAGHTGTGTLPYSISVSLHPGAAARLAAMSATAIGQRVDVILCGRVVMAPVLQTAIPGGQLALTGIETSAEIDPIMGYLHGVLPCPKE